MERLTELLGFEAGYLIYPLLIVAIASLARFLIRRYLMGWAAETKTDIDNLLVRYLDSVILPLTLIAVLYFVSNLFSLSGSVVGWIQRGLVVVAIAVLMVFSARLSYRLLERLGPQRPDWERFVRPLQTLSNALFALIGVALILKVMNFDLTDDGVRFIRVIGIIVGTYVVMKIVRLAMLQIEDLVEDKQAVTASEVEKRAKTLGKILHNFALVLVVGVAATMILSEFGIDVTPIITGAGIAGLAVGFGAQNLVRDIISGFFLILEDQVRVGDVARINGTGGLVEAIRLRTTVLRDLEGIVHVFPNGEIQQVSNLTKEWSRYVIDVGVAYKEDVDYVMDVLREIGQEMAEDEGYGPLILEPLEILGVDDFGDSQITIKTMIKTLPLKQWVVGRELRRRIKNTFDEKGIEIPFPHLSVYFGEASKPFSLLLQQSSEQPNLREHGARGYQART